MCERSTMGRGQQNQRISTVERKLKKREQKTKGLVYWFKHWLIDLQVTANVKGPSHRTSLPPSHPPSHPRSVALPVCASALRKIFHLFPLCFALSLFLPSLRSPALSTPSAGAVGFTNALVSSAPPFKFPIALLHNRHHLSTPA